MAARSIIPVLVYEDAPAAIAWLCTSLGFREHLVVTGPDGTIVHAELTRGEAMIMLGSAGDGTPFKRITRSPMALQGLQTQSAYIVVQDPDAVHDLAVRHGARIVDPLKDEAHGGRSFTCADPEGHWWSFGSYDPWKNEPRPSPAIPPQSASRIAEQWFRAFNDHDLEALLALYSPDARHFSPKLLARRPETQGWIQGRDALRSWWADAFDRLRTLRYQPTALIAEGNRVFMEYIRHVDGEEDLRVGEVLEISEGLIIASRVYHG